MIMLGWIVFNLDHGNELVKIVKIVSEIIISIVIISLFHVTEYKVNIVADESERSTQKNVGFGYRKLKRS